MSADRVRFVHGITKELEKLGCKKLETIDEYNALWVVLQTNLAFTVPIFDKEDKCPEAMWPDVLAAIAKAKTQRPA